MDRSDLLAFGGVVIGFFLLGQAIRSVADGRPLLGALGALIGVAVLATAFRLR
jgi:hypothetical protein